MGQFKFRLLILILTSFIFLIKESYAIEKKTVGVILPSNVTYYEEIHTHFLKKMEANIVGGQIDFLIQKPFPDPVALSNAARKLIAHNVDIIFCYGTEATIVTLKERPDQPVIYVAGYTPALERYRTKNSTGVEFKTPISSIPRYLNSMKEIKTLGVIYNPLESDSLYQLNEIMRCCPFYKMAVIKLVIKRPSDIRQVIEDLNVDALIFTTSSIVNIALSAFREHSSNNMIPIATLLPRREAKPTIALYPSAKKQAEKAAAIVQAILKGKKPHEIARDSSADMELIFNIGEAQRMGLRISADLLTEATEVIH
ncbi:MAG: ABC transporter substrate-binding protein [Thermodesulfovibrionales bacterium]